MHVVNPDLFGGIITMSVSVHLPTRQVPFEVFTEEGMMFQSGSIFASLTYASHQPSHSTPD